MGKRRLAAFALIALGLSVAAAGRPAKHANFSNEALVDTNPTTSEKPNEELAKWLIKEGNMRLRAGSFNEAKEAAILSKILDPNAEHSSLMESITKTRAMRCSELLKDAGEAREAGDMARLAKRMLTYLPLCKGEPEGVENRS